MKKLLFFLAFAILFSCGREESDKEVGNKEVKTKETFSNLQKLVTKGIPSGFRQRDYTQMKNMSKSYSTIQLTNGKRSFILEMTKGIEAPALAPFSGKYNDMEAMFNPDNSLLLFASDRPTHEGDTLRDFNLWYIPVKEGKLGDPHPFDSIINSPKDEFYPCMNSRGDLYFTAKYHDRSRDDLYVSRKTDSGYVKPEKLNFCSPRTYEFNAWVSPDDSLIIFTSYGRKNEQGGGDLYFARKDKDGKWQTPVAMNHKVNTRGLDFSPFVKGDTLFFTSQRIDDSWMELSFEYLSSIQRHADTTTSGEQGIYITPLSSALGKD